MQKDQDEKTEASDQTVRYACTTETYEDADQPVYLNEVNPLATIDDEKVSSYDPSAFTFVDQDHEDVVSNLEAADIHDFLKEAYENTIALVGKAVVLLS